MNFEKIAHLQYLHNKNNISFHYQPTKAQYLAVFFLCLSYSISYKLIF